MNDDTLSAFGGPSSYLNTPGGLKIDFSGGSTAILEGITVSQAEAAGWLM